MGRPAVPREPLGAKSRTDAASPTLYSKYTPPVYLYLTAASRQPEVRVSGCRRLLLLCLLKSLLRRHLRLGNQLRLLKNPLMIRQMFLRLYTCCYLCGASTPCQMWRNSYRCLPYLSSANVTRQRLASAGLLVESLRVPASCAGSLFFASCGQDVAQRICWRGFSCIWWQNLYTSVIWANYE